ncbi:MAG: DUF4012 domain-containing protein [Actinomycetota bacterium]|nr:DUF4012 domain-containing protein [Actinomycetota bacterium]
MILRGERRRGERRPSPEPIERILVVVIGAASSVGALFVDAHPTANRISDAAVVVVFVVGVVAASSIARATAWIFAGALAVLLGSGPWAIVAVGALVIGIIGAVVGHLRYRRAVGALAGGLIVQTILRLHGDRFGMSAAAAVLIVAPLVLSAWSLAHGSTRTRVRNTALVAGGLALIIMIGFSLAVLRSRGPLELGVQRAEEGLAASRAGDTERAGVLLAQASRAFQDADGTLGSWFAQPASVLPALGQHERALHLLSAAGADASSAAAVAAARADVQRLSMHGGRIDLARVADMAGPLSSVDRALHRAGHVAARVQSPWLLSPLARRLDTFRASIGDATRDAQTASEAVDVLPRLFGGDRERLYFVAFTTPAEARDLGGFTGAYGLLRAKGGKLTLVRTGRIESLNEAGVGRHLTDPTVFPARYRSMRLEDFWQNITGTADFPTVAEAVRQMWPQSGGKTLDGVISIDPYALASLLKLTGPVSVRGRAEPLTADNAAQFLLRGQYQTYDVINERSDFLLASARTVFKRLTTGDLPGPRTIADALAPVAHERRLLVHSFHPEEQRLFARLGVTGALPPVRGDFLSVRSSNLGQNKIDAFLHRTIDDQVVVDPGRDVVRATVTVTLRNSASATGLPAYVTGNLVGAPRGTNVSTLAVYTPLRLRRATVDGRRLAVGATAEYGRFVYTARLDVGPRTSVRARFELEGPVDLRSGYRLDVVPQPAAITDRMQVRVRGTNRWELSGRASVAGRIVGDARLVIATKT